MDVSIEQIYNRIVEASEAMKILILAGSTLVSEDLTTIGAGILVSREVLSFWTATLGCFVGIFLGDGLLYLLGLLVGKPVMKLPILRDMLTEEKVLECQNWFRDNGVAVVMISRFLPGTRLPTYFAAGLLGSEARYFLPAAAIATAVWTPLLVLTSMFVGQTLLEMAALAEEYQWLVLVVSVVLMFLFLRGLMKLTNPRFRRLLRSRMKRFFYWEFWPVWLVYVPVLGYNLLLMLRYRRLKLPLICNPGIELSGYIGESKTDILNKFKGERAFFPRHLFLSDSMDMPTRLAAVEQWMAAEGIPYPIVVKPDVGQRGSGVKKVHNRDELIAYLEFNPLPLHVQENAEGPYEFGVFYYRFPDEPNGQIMGITAKEFPLVVGNGKDTVEHLIMTHPLAMGRLHLFLKRHEGRLSEVLPEGESLSLVETGNHCLGTVFRDGSHLLTDALTQKIDAISKTAEGIYIGRYDIRATSLEDFRMGRAFKIIELNGAAGEPGHIYDPRHTPLFGYLTLFRQYNFIWRIGHLNARAGHKTPSPLALLKKIREYRRQARFHPKGQL